mmetsp:Transcript_31763/g.69967  ORF Transcript_31763/g.69967 Transcript_31763/m.69967 type:complete len:217 (-) Transcript_31763:432-1082(-)
MSEVNTRFFTISRSFWSISFVESNSGIMLKGMAAGRRSMDLPERASLRPIVLEPFIIMRLRSSTLNPLASMPPDTVVVFELFPEPICDIHCLSISSYTSSLEATSPEALAALETLCCTRLFSNFSSFCMSEVMSVSSAESALPTSSSRVSYSCVSLDFSACVGSALASSTSRRNSSLHSRDLSLATTCAGVVRPSSRRSKHASTDLSSVICWLMRS